MSIRQTAQCRRLGTLANQTFLRYGRLCNGSETPRFSSTETGYPTSRRNSVKERQRAEREQLIKSLKESPGKRDARNFLKHFDTSTKVHKAAAVEQDRAVRDAVEKAHHNEWRLTRTGVNLGNLYEPTKAIQDSPVFSQQPLPEKRGPELVEPLHIALVKLRQPQVLDDETLGGLALTLSQMVRLGLNIAVVVDCDDDVVPNTLELSPPWEDLVREQSTRIVDALEEYNEPGAFEVDHALTVSELPKEIPATVHTRGVVEVKHNHLIFPPIEDGIIPVIPPWAYNAELKKVRVRPDDVVLALTREFAGLTKQIVEAEDTEEGSLKESKGPDEGRLLDRIIVLDPLGGLPSDNRVDGAHVFVNLEAEYQDVRKELEKRPPTADLRITSSEAEPSLGASNPFSAFVETEMAPSWGPSTQKIESPQGPNRHVQNLDVVQKALKLLPPSSSALIITPTEAAISSQVPFMPSPSTGVRTRRSKNPLIHNLLTDKPMISSSLPAPLVDRVTASTAPTPATFLKKGIPVTLIPDPRLTGGWQPPSPGNPSIELEKDPRINFPRLVELIEDSFRRKLDARHYLDRIRGRVAGLIVAGDYEGGAICTWETHPDVRTTPPPDSPLWVPYLDKFAVLTTSQGSGGVADIVWNALTRSCFPNGLVWRSRTSNPVNKWYFERAVGMWNLPDGQWTMFWTTEGVVEEWAEKKAEKRTITADAVGMNEMTRWDSYVGVCGGVVPSWADNRKPD
ncbi:N-acetylglutamate synthase [Westerdykella ornata]|uniref:Amino-acid acetyltransferase, mitochondrial n=1 Tax=Westerdykella ornata TaxID=318751 RepID=A0A6A6JHQ8_WESOR|nr:N-acetylglutamate synthase [Westerdykella ornata]KAF2275755.1 N-acetylglutamate synthase [Westerdykella ornata]